MVKNDAKRKKLRQQRDGDENVLMMSLPPHKSLSLSGCVPVEPTGKGGLMSESFNLSALQELVMGLEHFLPTR